MSDHALRSVPAPVAPLSPTPPWLVPLTARLDAARRSGRFPHSLLLQGSPGIGARWLSEWIASALLCMHTDRAPCGECRACRWIAQREHPDLMILDTSEDSRQIRIEQVRELAGELALRSHQGGARVALLLNADALNRNSANALLKTLEEPPPGAFLVLAAALPSRLPATIRSRCQTLRLPQPGRAASLEWLRLADPRADWEAVLDIVGENPLTAREVEPAAAVRLRADTLEGLERAMRRQGNTAELAERWSKSELPLRLRLFETWLTNRIRASVSKPVITAEMRPEAHLSGGKYVMNIGPLFELLEGVRELQSALEGPINRSLALELLLARLGARAA